MLGTREIAVAIEKKMEVTLTILEWGLFPGLLGFEAKDELTRFEIEGAMAARRALLLESQLWLPDYWKTALDSCPSAVASLQNFAAAGNFPMLQYSSFCLRLLVVAEPFQFGFAAHFAPRPLSAFADGAILPTHLARDPFDGTTSADASLAHVLKTFFWNPHHATSVPSEPEFVVVARGGFDTRWLASYHLVNN